MFSHSSLAPSKRLRFSCSSLIYVGFVLNVNIEAGKYSPKVFYNNFCYGENELILMDAEMNHNSEFQQITLIKQQGKFKEKFLLLGQDFHVKTLCAAVPKTCQAVFTCMGSLYHLQLAWRPLMSPLTTAFTVQAQEPLFHPGTAVDQLYLLGCLGLCFP